MENVCKLRDGKRKEDIDKNEIGFTVSTLSLVTPSLHCMGLIADMKGQIESSHASNIVPN